jgi:glutaredoxin 3
MGIIEETAATAETDFLLYTTTFCPYCVAAKRLLKDRGLTYQEINFDEDHSTRMAVVDATGHRTVPIVIDIRGEAPVFVGGFNETQSYLRS